MATVKPSAPAGDNATHAPHRYAQATLAVHATLGSADILDFRDFSELAIKLPASATGVTVYGAETEAGTFVLVDNIGTNGAVTITAERWFTMDVAKIKPYGFLKFQSAGANGNAVVACKT